MILEKQILLIFNHPNLDGITYTREEIEEVKYRSKIDGLPSYFKAKDSEEYTIYSEIKKLADDDACIGEAMSFDQRPSSIVMFQNTSHLITNLEINDDCIYGDVKILKTPMGNIVSNVMDKCGKDSIAVRPRSISNPDGLVRILTFDIVSNEEMKLK